MFQGLCVLPLQGSSGFIGQGRGETQDTTLQDFRAIPLRVLNDLPNKATERQGNVYV